MKNPRGKQDMEKNNTYETEATRLMSLILQSSDLLRHKLYGKGQHRVLYLLYRHGNMTQRELMNFRGIRSASLSEILKRMEENGFILRERSGGDRRKVLITLTDCGILEAERFGQERMKTAEALFQTLGSERKSQLGEALGQLTENWQETPLMEDKNMPTA